ncbi:MAG: hypothetical protein IPH58_13000 [Sphingobacteriales bacterium]|nr:hypothetical protein [Sphingobacteriales bacterium]
MISVIISSHNTEYFNIVSKSIKETIGTEHEIIKIENHAQYGLCEAYNMGMTQAKFDILCFCHEDIIFHTKNWGKIVLDMFLKESTLGIVGIAGAANKSKAPSSWWGTYSDLQFMNIIHGESNSLYEYENEFEGPIEKQRMALIDGVFMCVRKDSKIFFNPLFKDFHFYDISLCMEYNIRNYTIRCTDKILIQHYSRGISTKNGWKRLIGFTNYTRITCQ